MTENILFDNLLITDDISVADKLADDRYGFLNFADNSFNALQGKVNT